MVSLVAKQDFTYARKPVHAGDRFEAHEGDVTILTAIGRAVRAEPSAGPTPQPRRPPKPVPPPRHPPADRPPADDDEHTDDDTPTRAPEQEPEPVSTTRPTADAIRRRPPVRRGPVGR